MADSFTWSRLLSLSGLRADAGGLGLTVNLKYRMKIPGSEATKIIPGTTK